MFAIKFYTYSKKENSTARPSTVALDANCIIKTGSGIIEPTIELDIGLSEAPPYNYCYIPAFGRYYWIREWYFESALWTANLAIDVLATARSYIGSSSLYVLRAASAYDGSVIDTLYPADTNFTFAMSQTNIGWSYDSGIYVMAIVTKTANFGSVRHYVLTPAQMAQMCGKLLNSNFIEGLGITSAEGSTEFIKCLIDPIQYIKSCIYIPVPLNSLGTNISTSQLIVFDWDTEIVAASVNHANPVYGFVNSNIQVADHPQAATRGKYLNGSPYTSRYLFVPPFGSFELDPDFLIDSDALSLEVNIDLTSGQGNLHVLNDSGREMNYIEAMIGVPINLSQVMRDWVGATQAIVGTAVKSFLNPAGAPSYIADGIGSAIESTKPKCQSVSGGGSFAGLRNGNSYLTSKFAHMVDDDLTEEGRPLCKTRTISSLSGFVKVKNGDIAAPYTGEELEKIRTYLEGGFYYE